MCVYVCSLAREEIGLVLFDCVFVFWVKEAGSGFGMSSDFTGWPLGVSLKDRERDGGTEREWDTSSKTKISRQSTWLIGEQASACLHPVCVVFTC